MRPRILDASAVIALLNAHPPVFHLLLQAEAGQVTVVMPATALAEANTKLKFSTSTWEPVLLTAGLEVPALTQHIAIEIGDWPGDVATRHVVHEAAAVQGIVITCRPSAYEGHTVPLLVV